MKEILVMAPCRERHRIMLEEAGQGQCRFHFIRKSDSPVRISQAVKNANVIIGEPDIRDLQHASNLDWVQMTWAGTDKYTKVPGFPRQVKLTNASGAFGSVIAEYVFGGILTLYRRFTTYRTLQKQQIWRDCGSERTMEGSRVLILGAGDIGENLARRFHAFYANVVGIRRTLREKTDYFDEMSTLDSLEEQLPLADIVIGCLPHTPATNHLINRQRLLMMKPDAVLVNVGRGSLIVTDDLADVMSHGHLLGAVLDVTEPEPLPSGHPLWLLDNVLLTPHIAGPSFEHSHLTEDKIYMICCDNLRRYLNGQSLLNEVNWETGYRQTL